MSWPALDRLSPGRWPVRLGVTALCVVLGPLLAACQASSGPPLTDRATLRTYLDQTPGVPLVLPVALPDGYLFLGPGFQRQDDGHLLSLRAADFRLDGSETSEVVEICVAEPGSSADVCVPPGGTSRAVRRSYGPYPVWIRPLGNRAFPGTERAFWQTAALTDDLGLVSWLT